MQNVLLLETSLNLEKFLSAIGLSTLSKPKASVNSDRHFKYNQVLSSSKMIALSQIDDITEQNQFKSIKTLLTTTELMLLLILILIVMVRLTLQVL